MDSFGICKPPTTLRLLGRNVKVHTDDALGVAGVPWPAQEIAGAAVRRFVRDPCTIVEIGAGCGALACALALDGHRVVATDLPEVMSLMQNNVTLNEAAVECHALRWGEIDAAHELIPSSNGPLLVIACEVAYWGGWDLFDEDTRGPLADTLNTLIGDHGLGLLVHKARDLVREVSILAYLRDRGLEVRREQPAGREPEEGEIGVWLLKRQGSECPLLLPERPDITDR